MERLLLYQDSANPAYSSKAAVRCILLHELCPALHTLLEDGLKVLIELCPLNYIENMIQFAKM